MNMSLGTGTCIGALGHSKHLAQVGLIIGAHDQFPADICSGYTIAGENVGEWSSGNELQDLQSIHNMMMAEGDTPLARPQCSPYVGPPCCPGGHDCNITDPTFQSVGIGIYYSNGTTWLTTDFVG
jgi:hypothetical protein